MNQIANVIGGCGLVGHQLILELLENPHYIKVRSFVRHSCGIIHPKLEEIIINFDQPQDWKHLVQGDVLFSTLGTTMKKAKTKENQYKVDFTYQFVFAWAAFENKVPDYVLVSSMGADSKAGLFYSRIKGELEEAISIISFRKLIIFRPSILDGNRSEKRMGERLSLAVSRFLTQYMMKEYMPTPVDLLTKKMISVSVDSFMGTRIIEGNEILSN